MKKVITYGTFDLLHYGHINLFRRAKELGDYLIVAVSTDEFNAIKNKTSFFDDSTRMLMVESIRYVDLVIPESSWLQKETDISSLGVSVLVMGDDWKGKFDHLKTVCDVVYLNRTPYISSSLIKDRLGRHTFLNKKA
jgi:glycerol-3-phosphate cytidylyltransferase